VLLDFDYPSKSDLSDVAALKADFPSIPMFMLTVQHSESLAVWAFRNGMRDFFVKPIAAAELERFADLLKRISESRSQQKSRPRVRMREALPREASAAPQRIDRALEPALRLVEQSFYEPLSNEQAAAACDMNAFSFSRQFKEHYQLGFHEYLIRYRLREACRLLASPAAVVSEVCYACGFNDASYFAKVFRKYFGELPSSYIGRPLTRTLSEVINEDYFPKPLSG
jgi:AraC-like DNA-binding protein